MKKSTTCARIVSEFEFFENNFKDLSNFQLFLLTFVPLHLLGSWTILSSGSFPSSFASVFSFDFFRARKKFPLILRASSYAAIVCRFTFPLLKIKYFAINNIGQYLWSTWSFRGPELGTFCGYGKPNFANLRQILAPNVRMSFTKISYNIFYFIVEYRPVIFKKFHSVEIRIVPSQSVQL